MNKSDRNLIITIIAIVAIIGGGYGGLVAYTGFSPPFSVVMSQSMQHDMTESHLGTIDTGDVMVIKDPSTTEICSYVKGTQTGYESFGDYGSVIIYDRGNDQNPVIHRAIVWLEYNPSTGSWISEDLRYYSGTWYYVDENGKKGESWNDIHGTLYFEGITSSGKNVQINLTPFANTSGYLTMGDNPTTNRYFDQAAGIVNHLISENDIRSVPIFEIPWLGTLKIFINGGKNLEYVTNSLPSLIMSFVTLFGFLIMLDGFTLYRNDKGIRLRIERMKISRR